MTHSKIGGVCGAHCAVLKVADFSQVHSTDHAKPRCQSLQKQADDGGTQQYPEELSGTAGGGVKVTLKV